MVVCAPFVLRTFPPLTGENLCASGRASAVVEGGFETCTYVASFSFRDGIGDAFWIDTRSGFSRVVYVEGRGHDNVQHAGRWDRQFV